MTKGDLMTNKALEARVKELEEQLEDAIENMALVERDFMHSYTVLQEILGIKFLKDGDQIRCAIEPMTKKNKNPGVLAQIYHRVNHLWKENSDKRIVTL
jgi:hypothetical protein